MRTIRFRVRSLAALIILTLLLLPLGTSLLAGTPADAFAPAAFPAPTADAGPVTPIGLTSRVVQRLRKAIYILPGICGSDLYAELDLSAADLLERAPDLTGISNPATHADAGESLWVPQSLHPLSALAMLACGADGRPLMTVRTYSDPQTYGPLGIYQYLYLRLQDQLGSEYDIRFFPYDWRMNNFVAAQRLQESISYAGYEEVILVAHSMGGLVASSFLAMSPANRAMVKQAYFIAVPFLGTPKTLYAAETGNIFNMPLLRGMTSPDAKRTAANFRSIPELLPTRWAFDLAVAPYVSVNGTVLTDYDSTAAFLRTLEDPGVNTSFLSDAEAFHRSLYLPGGEHAAAAVDSFFFSGVGRPVIHTVRYDAAGRMTGADFSGSGDGTVPVWSSSLGVSLSESGNAGIMPDQVVYKNVSHFGFLLDVKTAGFIISRIRGGDPVPADYGFATNADQPEKDSDAVLDRLAQMFENGMLVLYLRSIMDKLVVSTFR